MFKTLKQIFVIMASSTANGFLYFIKRLPILRKHISDAVYRDILLKRIFTVIALIFMVLSKVLKKAFYLMAVLAFPIFVLTDSGYSADSNVPLYIYAVLSIFGALQFSTVLDTNRERFLCVRQMRMDAGKYLKARIIFNDLSNFAAMFLPMAVVSFVFSVPLYKTVLLLTMQFFLRIGGEALELLIYEKTGVILTKNYKVILPIGTVFLAAAYVPLFFGTVLDMSAPAVYIPAVLISVISFIAGGIYLIQYKNYMRAVIDSTKFSDFAIDSKAASQKTIFASVALKDSDFTEASRTAGVVSSKKGYDYLNDLFYKRHKRLLVKPILIRLAFVGVVLLAGLVLAALNMDTARELISRIYDTAPLFVFVMYLLAVGDKICKAMFYNCDISLLRYGFYRSPKVILSNFRIRLGLVAKLNLIVAAGLLAAVFALHLITNIHVAPITVLSFAAVIIMLSLFFSVHHLFLYYVFQPYTTDLEVKNPFFGVLNSIVYIIAYVCLQIQTASLEFAFIVISVTLLYIMTALILVYVRSPKTFRVK